MNESPALLLAEAKALAPEIVAWRRHLHANPELSFKEFETTDYLDGILSGWGLETVRKTPTGLWFDIPGSRPGPTVLVRADIDALPIEEMADVPFRSQRPGVMHACGHDGHTAIALGVTRLLGAHREELSGRVRVLFQPAEEQLPGGAPMMIAAGVLAGVDTAIGLHLMPVMSDGLLRAGEAIMTEGPAMACPDTFRIVVEGQGGHGAMPHMTVDPIPCAATIVSALQTIVSRHVDPLVPAVVTVASIHAGGASNVIPPDVSMTGTVRTFDERTRALIEKTMARLVADTAAAFGARAEFAYERGYPVLVNATAPSVAFEATVKELLGPDALRPCERMMGGEDFAYILQERPGAFLWLGCGNEDVGATYINHHPAFSIDEAALPLGAAVLAATAMHLLEA